MRTRERSILEEIGLLEKAVKGEGSKGGKVVGHTKSGKPIYEDKHHHEYDVKSFSARDHMEAAKFHKKAGRTSHYEGHLWGAAKKLGHAQGIFQYKSNDEVEKMLEDQLTRGTK